MLDAGRVKLDLDLHFGLALAQDGRLLLLLLSCFTLTHWLAIAVQRCPTTSTSLLLCLASTRQELLLLILLHGAATEAHLSLSCAFLTFQCGGVLLLLGLATTLICRVLQFVVLDARLFLSIRCQLLAFLELKHGEAEHLLFPLINS